MEITDIHQLLDLVLILTFWILESTSNTLILEEEQSGESITLEMERILIAMDMELTLQVPWDLLHTDLQKKTTLFAVKVLNCEGSGTYDGIISGVSWTVTSFQSRKKPSVANMSLGGGMSTILNNAINSAVASGVVFVVAAGNENANACNVSPASAASAITVGASGVDSTGAKQIDNRAYFSNYGKCTDIFAPGLTITSTWIGTKNTEIHTISGTSMASPHIAGVVALYLGDHTSSTPAQVRSYLVSTATNGNVRMDCTSALEKTSCNETPNIFVHHACA